MPTPCWRASARLATDAVARPEAPLGLDGPVRRRRGRAARRRHLRADPRRLRQAGRGRRRRPRRLGRPRRSVLRRRRRTARSLARPARPPRPRPGHHPADPRRPLRRRHPARLLGPRRRRRMGRPVAGRRRLVQGRQAPQAVARHRQPARPPPAATARRRPGRLRLDRPAAAGRHAGQRSPHQGRSERRQPAIRVGRARSADDRPRRPPAHAGEEAPRQGGRRRHVRPARWPAGRPGRLRGPRALGRRRSRLRRRSARPPARLLVEMLGLPSPKKS